MSDTNIKGRVAFDLGGTERVVFATLGIAPDIEEATGEPLMTLIRQATGMRTSHAASIIAAATAGTNNPMSRAAVLEAAGVEGMAAMHGAAMRILLELFRAPEGAAKKGKARPAAT